MPLKKRKLYLGLIVFQASCMMLFAQQKSAQTGFQFLTVGTEGHAAGMGEAFTSISGKSSSLLFNPAGIALMEETAHFSGGVNEWIADIQYQSLTLAYSPFDGEYGVFGLSFLRVDYGEFLGTMVWPNDNGYIDTQNFSPQAMSIGVGYGRSLTDKFSVGAHLKYVVQSTGESVVADNRSSTGLAVENYVLDLWAVDFGTLYKTGFKSLVFGMSVRNFSEEKKFEQEGFQLPLSFRIGISMNMVDFYEEFSDKHKLILSLDAVHPRALNEFVAIGLDYTFIESFSVRTGFISGQNEYNFSYGIGVKQFGFAFDYAFVPFGVFENVQKMTVSYTLQ